MCIPAIVPQTLCPDGKVQEGGSLFLGLGTLVCFSERQHKPPPESHVTVCRTTGAYTAYMHTLAREQPAQSAPVD